MTSSNSYYYDNHTLFIKCDCANAEQITIAFREALTNIKDKIKIDGRYRVNLVDDKQGKSYGIAFVFVTDSAIYHMLLGKNPDGTDRIEYRDDPSWEPPKDGELTNNAGWSTIAAPAFRPGVNWADFMDEEDEYERQLEVERKRGICPKIPIQLEPLIVLPPFKLTEQQIAEKRDKIIMENEGKPNFDHKMVEVPELAYFGVSRAMVSPVDSKFMPNILKCRGIPSWVTKDDLKTQFTPYASDSKTEHERYIKGRPINEAYPFVNINEDRVAFIIFDPSTHDAQFALHMMKKTIIRKVDSGGKLFEVTLIFNHSYRTDRDTMADITLQPRFSHKNEKPSKEQTNYEKSSRGKFKSEKYPRAKFNPTKHSRDDTEYFDNNQQFSRDISPIKLEKLEEPDSIQRDNPAQSTQKPRKTSRIKTSEQSITKKLPDKNNKPESRSSTIPDHGSPSSSDHGSPSSSNQGSPTTPELRSPEIPEPHNNFSRSSSDKLSESNTKLSQSSLNKVSNSTNYVSRSNIDKVTEMSNDQSPSSIQETKPTDISSPQKIESVKPIDPIPNQNTKSTRSNNKQTAKSQKSEQLQDNKQRSRKTNEQPKREPMRVKINNTFSILTDI